MNIEQELNELGSEIKQAEVQISKAEGSLETLMKRLKDEEDINTLEEAVDLIEEIDEGIKNLSTSIQSKIEELKEVYEW